MSIRNGVRESRTEIERVKPSDRQRKRKGETENGGGTWMVWSVSTLTGRWSAEWRAGPRPPEAQTP